MKKSIYLYIGLPLFVMLWVLMVAHGVAYAGTGFGEDQKSDQVAQKLIDKASYHYGLLEDYPNAIRFLKDAIDKTENPKIQAEAWLKIAYVSHLMEQAVDIYIPFIKNAIKLDPELSISSVNYQKSFLDIFKLVKKNPDSPGAKPKSKSNGTLERSQLFSEDEEPEYEEPQKKKKRIFLSAGAYGLMHADSNYRDVYGSIHFVPRFKLGILISRRISIWGGASFSNSSGTIPDTDLEAESKQLYIMFGAGYYLPVSKKMDVKMELGFMKSKFEESALDLKISENAGGFSYETGLIYYLTPSLYLDFSVGYMNAAYLLETHQAKIGGLFSGISIGLRL